MPCYYPVAGYHKPGGGFTTSPNIGYRDLPMTVACGRCIGCRLDYSFQWGIRCMHEKRMHVASSYVTLTYDETTCPADMSLDVTVHQRFMKRLRKACGTGIKFALCGEYGSLCERCLKSEKYCLCPGPITDPLPGRPHYHAILFGVDFSDKRLLKTNNGNPLYTSAQLAKLWPLGFSSVGEVTFDSCCYVARYVTKKKSGDKFADHYLWPNEAGIWIDRKPEYFATSLGGRTGPGGLGLAYYRKYGKEMWNSDSVVMAGYEVPVPRYYVKQLEKEDEAAALERRKKRVADARSRAWNNTPDRLRVREECARARVNLNRRGKQLD